MIRPNGRADSLNEAHEKGFTKTTTQHVSLRETESQCEASEGAGGLATDNAEALDPIQGELQPSSLHLSSIFSLCVGMLTHSYLVISVFPYSGFMVMSLIDSANEDNAGTYAGLLASSFNFGRVMTAYLWGRCADTYGRKIVLLFSLGLSSFFCLLFGLSPSFWLALVIRFIMGMCNGIVGTNKTLVSDLASGDEQKEAKAMSLVLGMWAWGFLVAPFVSGQLAEPVKQYPDFQWGEHGILAWFLQKFPFFLPNLLGAILCWVAMALCYFFICEPLPADKRRDISLLWGDLTQFFKSAFSFKRQYRTLPVLKEHQSDIEFAPEDENANPEDGGCQEKEASARVNKETITIWGLMSMPQTRSCLLVYWGNSFTTLAIDEMFPLFCISLSAGFGVEERTIGQILSASGMIFATSQYFIQSAVYSRFGLIGSIRVGASLCAPIILLIPASLLINGSAEEGKITVFTFLYLCIVLALTKSFFLVFFANISVAINQSVPPEHRAALNGLSVLGSSTAKGLGPSFAGLTATMSVSLLHKFGSLLMFGSLGLVSSLVAASSFLYLGDRREEGEADEIAIEMVEDRASADKS